MKPLTRAFLSILGLVVTAPPSWAHYSMLLPENASAKKGESVALTYQWGHPFEHQLFDAPEPKSLFVIGPDGKRNDLGKTWERISIPTADAKKVRAFRIAFKPELRGDYVFFLTTAPMWMEEEAEFWEDTVKVVLHVQAQKGWDAAVMSGFEILPLTRPYGLQPGMVFQVEVDVQPKPRDAGAFNGAGAMVEIERYNTFPPKTLPADEQITRTAKTDRKGVVTCTLTEAGWWCLTAQRDGGKMARDGKDYPVRQRTTFWVFVDQKIPGQ